MILLFYCLNRREISRKQFSKEHNEHILLVSPHDAFQIESPDAQ